MSVVRVILLSFTAALAWAGEPTADEIMARVADNQERTLEARSTLVYHQRVQVRLMKSGNKLSREAVREYLVTPTAAGFERQQVSFSGRAMVKGQVVNLDVPDVRYGKIDIDGEVAEELSEEFGGEKDARDGIHGDLFPLTAKHLPRYHFRLDGRQEFRGRPVWRVTFTPKKKAFDTEDGGSPWEGEVLVDCAEYQPALVTSFLSKGIPMAVRVLLGTNLKHLGFKLTYRKVAEGVWMPDTYSGEFGLRAVFFYGRTISLSMQNSDFRKADVTSTVRYEP